jgi:hypothetical protein
MLAKYFNTVYSEHTVFAHASRPFFFFLQEFTLQKWGAAYTRNLKTLIREKAVII